jgi:hypothetical protein
LDMGQPKWRLSKGRKPKTWIWLMCSLYRREYSNLKLAKATMGRWLRNSEEDW